MLRSFASLTLKVQTIFKAFSYAGLIQDSYVVLHAGMLAGIPSCNLDGLLECHLNFENP